MRARGRANRGDAYRMQNDMKMIYNEAKMKCLEVRAHGHANRENGIRNAMMQKWHTEYRMDLYQDERTSATLTWEAVG